MKTLFKNLIFTGITIFSTAALAEIKPSLGAGDGGGGDAIRCDDGKLYSWDYVQTISNELPMNPALVEFQSAKEILNYFIIALDNKIPGLVPSLKDFATFNKNPMIKAKRLWKHGNNPLSDLPDQAKRRVPRSCIKDQSKPIVLYQAVVRKKLASIITYDYDPAVLTELEETSPIQLSFLYVHEWLRDFTNDPSKIMDINNLLHSSSWLNESGAALRNAFANYGVVLRLESYEDRKTRLATEARDASETAAQTEQAEKKLFPFKMKAEEARELTSSVVGCGSLKTREERTASMLLFQKYANTETEYMVQIIDAQSKYPAAKWFLESERRLSNNSLESIIDSVRVCNAYFVW